MLGCPLREHVDDLGEVEKTFVDTQAFFDPQFFVVDLGVAPVFDFCILIVIRNALTTS
jgi:hypothetical protein